MNSSHALAQSRIIAGTSRPISCWLVEGGPRGGGVDRGIDRFDVAFELIPVVAGGEPERVADQMDDASLRDRGRPHIRDHLRQAFQAVADHEKHIFDAAVRRSVSTLIQNLAPSPPVPAHSPRMSLSPSKLTPIAV